MKVRVAAAIGMVAAFSVFSNALMLTGPLFMLQVYDRVLSSRSEETLAALFSLVAGLYALYALFEYSRSRIMAHIGAKLQSEFSPQVFRAALQHSALATSRIAGGVRDLEPVRSVLGSPVALAVFDLPWTALFIAAIFIFHPLLGWLAVLGGGVLIIVALLNQALTVRKARLAAERNLVALRFAGEAERRSQFIWAQGMQNVAMERFLRVQSDAIELAMIANDWTGTFSALTKALRLFLQSAMLALGAWLVLQQQLTAGAMVAASIMLGRALQPIDIAIGQWPSVQAARRAWRDIKSLLTKVPDIVPPTALPKPKGDLSVRNVTVPNSKAEKPILNQVAFAITPGEALGIIGRSGSGKSTLARVLTGVLRPAAGEIRLGGATLAQYGSEVLGQHVGYLPQEVEFFDATIAENIARLSLIPDAQRVVAAATKARVHDIILELPDGYDTRIGPGYTQLSGGQKQRLALARALYSDPVLLVLDEPNSALDAEGVQALNLVIKSMKSEGKSVIVMTHRPIAIQTCDKLMVLDGGRVKAFGPRDEVVKSMLVNADQVDKTLRSGGAE